MFYLRKIPKKMLVNFVMLVVFLIGLGVMLTLGKIEKQSQINRTKNKMESLLSQSLSDWKDSNVKDDWGNKVVISQGNSESHVVLTSAGPDCQMGTDDDIKCDRDVSFVDKVKETFEIDEKPKTTTLFDKAKRFFKK